jgi:hypothetical protein
VKVSRWRSSAAKALFPAFAPPRESQGSCLFVPGISRDIVGETSLSDARSRLGTYNGFSAEERGASSRWERELLRSGWKRPTKCIACGQNRGVVDAHLEDYSQPFEISRQIPLCYRCHIFAVHLRHRYPVQTAVYRSWVRRGFRAPALFTRNFGRLISDHVTHAALVDWQFSGVPARLVLDEIAEGKLCPPGRVPGNVPARQHEKSEPGAK